MEDDTPVMHTEHDVSGEIATPVGERLAVIETKLDALESLLRDTLHNVAHQTEETADTAEDAAKTPLELVEPEEPEHEAADVKENERRRRKHHRYR